MKESVLKLLLRVKKMEEAKPEVKKILTMILFRKMKVKHLAEELQDSDNPRDLEIVRLLYSELIRISSKILRKIENMQNIEVCLKRQFVFEGIRYDDCEGYLFT